jgi:hypothetical protein
VPTTQVVARGFCVPQHTSLDWVVCTAFYNNTVLKLCQYLLLQQEGLISILSDKEYMQNTWRNLCYLKELIKAGEVPEIA